MLTVYSIHTVSEFVNTFFEKNDLFWKEDGSCQEGCFGSHRKVSDGKCLTNSSESGMMSIWLARSNHKNARIVSLD